MKYAIREIREVDNKAVEHVIRTCLIEFGANHDGTAWADPDLGRFSEVYQTKENKYWVVVSEDDRIVGGVGIGKMMNAPGVCELQKMYCLPEVRGTGIATELIQTALAYAGQYYTSCYLETMDNMLAAQRFYEKHGFHRIYEPVGNTGHYSCDVLYRKDDLR